MGPRLFSRGNGENLKPGCLQALLLQWGRDSSAAEINRRSAGEAGPPQLQWGRDSSAAEMIAEAGETAARATASMGPRLFSRGNVDTSA